MYKIIEQADVFKMFVGEEKKEPEKVFSERNILIESENLYEVFRYVRNKMSILYNIDHLIEIEEKLTEGSHEVECIRTDKVDSKIVCYGDYYIRTIIRVDLINS